MTVEKKVSLGNVIVLVVWIFSAGIFYAQTKQLHDEVVEMKGAYASMNQTIQTQALTIQKLSDALEHLQNPNLPGPVRPVRYYYAPSAPRGHEAPPVRDDVLNGQ